MRMVILAILFCFFAYSQSQPAAQSQPAQNQPVPQKPAVTTGPVTREQRSKLFEIAKSYELRPMTKPEWADRKDAPLFRVAWFSDTHIASKEMLPLMKSAFRYARANNADFAIFTGDNVAYHSEKFRKLKPGSIRNHAWFKAFLDAELKIPYKVICGDNWHHGFTEFFGSRNFSFDAKGFHFVFTSLDARARRAEGCCKFDDATLDWLRDDLSRNVQKPTLFVLHETLWPPTFLDTTKVEGILKEQNNVLAALSGHLHLDLDLTHAGLRQIVCPSLGRSHRPGFKLMNFYSDAIIIESCELNEKENTFFMADKWQRIIVPERLKPVSKALDLKNTSEMAPVKVRRDDELAQRSKELYNALLGFALTMGLQSMFQ